VLLSTRKDKELPLNSDPVKMPKFMSIAKPSETGRGARQEPHARCNIAANNARTKCRDGHTKEAMQNDLLIDAKFHPIYCNIFCAWPQPSTKESCTPR